MSSWKIAVRALYELGPSTVPEIERHVRARSSVQVALKRATEMALVASSGSGRGFKPWKLTQRGVDWCENRVQFVELKRPGGRICMATWLASLPRDIRIGGST